MKDSKTNSFSNSIKRLAGIDPVLTVSVILLNGMGLLSIRSITEVAGNSSILYKQAAGSVIGIIVMLFLSLIDTDKITKYWKAFYVITMVALIAVLIFGSSGGGARRWISIAGLTFQPSELTKVLMIIFMAEMLRRFKEKEAINSLRCIALFFMSIGIPILLIYKQPDLSTTICFTFVMLIMLYLSGLSYKIIGVAILILVPVTGTFIWYIQQPNQKLLYAHQVQRILSFIYPAKYAEENVQQLNSVMAIGSGKLGGKGLLLQNSKSTVASSKLVSEQQTDFIFSIIGEATGFVGSVIVVGLILLIVLQCIRIARRSKDTCGMLLSGGAAGLIGFQSFINIAVATAFIPNTGIPLPFISYGLTSLLTIAILIGIVLNISLQKKQF